MAKLLIAGLLFGSCFGSPPPPQEAWDPWVSCPAPDGGWYEVDGGVCPCDPPDAPTCVTAACEELRARCSAPFSP